MRVSDVTAEMSFDLLDRLNETLLGRGEAPIAFDSDGREGICGACGVTINGRPHGPLPGTTTCQLPRRPFAMATRSRSSRFGQGFSGDPRSLRRSQCAGSHHLGRRLCLGAGGQRPMANTLPVRKPVAEAALDAAACIGWGPVAALPERLGLAVYGSEATTFGAAAAGAARIIIAIRYRWSRRWTRVSLGLQQFWRVPAGPRGCASNTSRR